MTRTLLAAFAFVAGCACSGESRDLHAYLPPAYGNQIQACLAGHQCASLCVTTFTLTEDQQLQSCKITYVDSAGGARIEAAIIDYGVCSDDSSVDVSIDDGTDDGTCDDGSCDDGSDDGSCDDGSCDDGSDDGSSDDGGDDGSDRRAPKAPVHVALNPVAR